MTSHVTLTKAKFRLNNNNKNPFAGLVQDFFAVSSKRNVVCH